MRDTLGILVIGGCAMLLLIAVAGCSSPQVRPHEQPRSMALNSRRMVRLERKQPPAESTPWYATRNDDVVEVWSGYEIDRREQVYQRTYDRRRHYDGRVHDHYEHESRQTEVFEIVR